jgi:hypothetical protein
MLNILRIARLRHLSDYYYSYYYCMVQTFAMFVHTHAYKTFSCHIFGYEYIIKYLKKIINIIFIARLQARRGKSVNKQT